MPRKTKRSRWQIEMPDSDLKNRIRAFRRFLAIIARLRQTTESWHGPRSAELLMSKSSLARTARTLWKLQREAQERGLKIPRRKAVELIFEELKVC